MDQLEEILIEEIGPQCSGMAYAAYIGHSIGLHVEPTDNRKSTFCFCYSHVCKLIWIQISDTHWITTKVYPLYPSVSAVIKPNFIQVCAQPFQLVKTTVLLLLPHSTHLPRSRICIRYMDPDWHYDQKLVRCWVEFSFGDYIYFYKWVVCLPIIQVRDFFG